jgi:phosphate starvation-inducible PhoH-like protein
MEKIEKRISIKGLDVPAFCGVRDRNLRSLKDHLGGTLILRGDELILTGQGSEVSSLGRAVDFLIDRLERGGKLEEDDVIEAIQRVKSSGFGGSDFEIITQRRTIRPRTSNQLEYLKAIQNNDIVISIGPAGTGKTFLAVAMALKFLAEKRVERLILTRPAVEAGESLGFLPGDYQEKINPYLTPLYDALYAMMRHEKVKRYIDKRIIEVAPLAYMRGRTLADAFLILDEAQNTRSVQMKMFLTRLGPNSKTVITGDITQIDLPRSETSGLVEIRKVLNKVPGIVFCRFGPQDVVRHRLVKDIVEAYERIPEEKQES